MITKISEVSSLRFIAMLMVLLYHLNGQLFPGGYIGVDVFFVISGYVVNYSWLKRETRVNQTRAADFYSRRIVRLMVPFLLVVSLCLVASFAVVLPFKIRFHIISFLASLTFISNIWFWRNGDYFSSDQEFNLFSHTWSLSIEWQFYLLFPWISRLLKIQSSKLVECILISTIGVSVLLSFILNYFGMFSFTFYNLPTRLFEFIIGVLFAYYYNISRFGRCQNWIKFVLLLLVLSIYLSQLFFEYLLPFHPHIGSFILSLLTGMLLYFFSGDKPISDIFNNRVFNYLGEISYSFYLWHLPVILITNIFETSEPRVFLNKLIPIAVTFTLSLLTYYYIESKKVFWSLKKSIVLYILAVSFGLIVFFRLVQLLVCKSLGHQRSRP